VEAREVTVVVEPGRIEVDAVARAIRKAFRFDALDEGDLLGNVIRRPAPDTGIDDVEAPQIVAERLGVLFGDLPRGLPLRREPASILSSPVSASEVRWPTSVMFITCLTR